MNIQDLYFNPFTSRGLFYHNSLDQSISNRRVSGKFILLLYFIEIHLFNASSDDPGQMLQSALFANYHFVCLFVLRIYRSVNPMSHAQCGQFT